MRDEAQQWLQLSVTDLATATQLRDDGIHYACVFFAQQAAEKALKAPWIGVRAEVPPRIHNLVVLARDLEAGEAVLQAAAELSPEYVLTRYITPEVASPPDLYDRASAQLHLSAAQSIVEWALEKRAEEAS